MKLRDLHTLPKLRDSLSYLYVDRAVIQRYRQSVEFIDELGRVAIPIASLSVLFLGPGTSITHEAVKLLAQNGCSVIWSGENVTHYYAQGSGETRSSARLMRQAALVSDQRSRLEVARRMYEFRFGEALDPDMSMEQLRGKEGARIRDTYRNIGQRYGIRWRGRRYDRHDWEASDTLNRALSAANALLNGICHAAIISAGYSSGLGFMHTGKTLSFVYDIADLYKAQVSIPLAFQIAALGRENVDLEVRRRCREKFREIKLLERIIPDIDNLLQITDEPAPDYDRDGALPGPLIDEILQDEPEGE
ncbi:type I-E CRISPR-associated endonuclease Cas1 [Anaerolineae bacterium CFX9]|nr:type I-E CRISPR-associated endonuclease Cas1 [Anaerolineae bacterium CFX9]